MPMTPYDLSLLPPDPPEQPAPTLAEALADLSAALGFAAAGATEQSAAGAQQEYHHGRAAGLRQAQRLVLALAAGLAPSSPPSADDLPPDLDF